MEGTTIFLLVLFLIVIVGGPLFCVTGSRSEKPKIYNPEADDINKALRKLSSVTTCSRVADRVRQSPDADVEASASQAEFGECPICIGPLIPEPAHTTGGNVQPPLEDIATVTVKASPKDRVEKRTEAGPAPPEGNTDQPDSQPESQQPESQEPESQQPDPQPDSSSDDILTLNTCGHSFHSKCLSSWFLIKRYDCPVCRTPYYHPRSLPILVSNSTP